MTDKTRITAVFDRLKASNQLAFMPFITSGDPDMDATLALIRELGRRGVDLIEIGFPYSDPIADGPVIQASYTRALNRKLKVDDIFNGLRTLPVAELPPLVAMVSYALLFRRGVERFIRQAVEAGFAGFIIPDLPADEAAETGRIARSLGVDLVQLISPTTPPERAERILAAGSGFVYCISIAGITGVRNSLPAELTQQLQWLRSKTSLPLAVGFGISRPEQVDVLRGSADGVIVGSAIVRQMEGIAADGANQPAVLNAIGQFAESMVAATHQSGR